MKQAFLLLTVLTFLACLEQPLNAKEMPLSAQDKFFNNMSGMCGKSFSGYSTFPKDPEHDFAGKLLVAKFISCEKNQIRIKFDVGSDQSRTWVITKSSKGLLLKHDHRHEDGTPDKITNYGGWASDRGTPWMQHFMADGETAKLIPEASTNVWMLYYNPQTETLTYDLKRHSKPRYQAQLQPNQ